MAPTVGSVALLREPGARGGGRGREGGVEVAKGRGSRSCALEDKGILEDSRDIVGRGRKEWMNGEGKLR